MEKRTLFEEDDLKCIFMHERRLTPNNQILYTLSEETVNLMKELSVTFYNDNSRLVAILTECVIIATVEKSPYKDANWVVLDELLLTYPEHGLIYARL